ncbi:MAG: hypothetical protein JNK79_10505 [Chitinophagaceae bacterium]|nr:hypothetical protein [Chitinophagaceae bacterium]
MKVKNFFFRLVKWETWHYLAKYVPIMPAWLWYCLKSRSFWFFTASNPTLTFGGFEGESKKEMYDQLPPGSYPNTILIGHNVPFEEVMKQVTEHNFAYPFAVKPDVGMMGFMFRTISGDEEFRQYHELMPADYLVQELVNYPLELSVFYYRFPNEQKGNITGFIRKEFLSVTGDGKSTLLELITKYPRVRFRLEEMKAKHKDRLDNILPNGEIFYLSRALNLSRGGKLVSLAHEKDDRLLKVFDDLSHYAGHFYYGRYDLKCKSIEDLKQGKNFLILEYNGCGAEPHHIYGNGNTLLEAYRIVLQHWKVLYAISKYNEKNGVEYWEFKKGYKFLRNAKKHFRQLKQLDLQTQV